MRNTFVEEPLLGCAEASGAVEFKLAPCEQMRMEVEVGGDWVEEKKVDSVHRRESQNTCLTRKGEHITRLSPLAIRSGSGAMATDPLL